MRKRFAPLALLFGLLTALMLGSTAVAQATTPLPTLTQCTNGVQVINGVNVPIVTCSDLHIVNNVVVETVKVIIADNDPHVLTAEELVTLKNNLNNANIDVDILNDASVYAAKLVVVNVYNNTINPSIPITVGDVKICVALVCK